MRYTLLLILGVSAIAAPALAQGPPGTNLRVDVRVARAVLRGDTTRLEYILRNHAQSREEVFTFTVDAPSPVIRISPSSPDTWSTGTSYRGRSVADWAALSRQVPPGTESTRLTFEAVGLPGIVAAWVRGYYQPPQLTEADTLPVVAPSDPMVENSVRLFAVGIEPFPANADAPLLIERLRGFADRACGELLWVTGAVVCQNLRIRLDRALQSLQSGKTDAAKGQLRSFLSQLETEDDSESRKQVTDNGYWLLRLNAAYILRMLTGS